MDSSCRHFHSPRQVGCAAGRRRTWVLPPYGTRLATLFFALLAPTVALADADALPIPIGRRGACASP